MHLSGRPRVDPYERGVMPVASRRARIVLEHVWQHPANRESRIRAVIRAVIFQLRGRMGRRTLTKIGESGRIWAELHYTASSSVVYGNPPDYREMQAWRRLLRPGDIFLDIGSNVGSYALWAGDLGAKVIAVEPNPDAARRLRENVSMNNFTIEVHECALADEPGEALLTVDLGTVNHLVLGSETLSGNVHNAVVKTLDQLVGNGHVRGVKIDVEGAERLVLEGGSRCLREGRIDVLQLEWNSMSEQVLKEDRTPVATLLRSVGYLLLRPTVDHGFLALHDDGYGRDVFAFSPAVRLELGNLVTP